MAKIDKCTNICNGIKDEQEGQEYYKGLIKDYPKDERQSNLYTQDVMLEEALADEIKHELFLRTLKVANLPKCICKQ